MQLGNLCYPAPINLLRALQSKIHCLRTFYHHLSNNPGKWRCPRRLAQLPLSPENPDRTDAAEEPVIAVFQGIAQLWGELLGRQQGPEKTWLHSSSFTLPSAPAPPGAGARKTLHPRDLAGTPAGGGGWDRSATAGR